MKKHRVVILGCGFGGLYTYLGLRGHVDSHNLEITVIDRRNYFLFTPLLASTITGSLDLTHVAEPVRKFTHKDQSTTFLQAEVLTINPQKKVVSTTQREVPFDYLVVALGAGTNYYHAPGAEHCFEVKDLGDTQKLKNHIITSFELASQTDNAEEQKRLLSFAVVGGGPTGVEVVAEMAELFNETLLRYYPKIPRNYVTLYLLNNGPRLLSRFHQTLSDNAFRVLKKKGVTIKLNSGVSEVRSGEIQIKDGSVIRAHTIVWVAGVQANTPSFTSAVPVSKNGTVMVNQFHQVESHPHMFALGDVACFEDKTSGRPLPMLAQVAVKQGKNVSANILRHLEKRSLLPFSYHSQGTLVSLGSRNALSDVHDIRFSGYLISLLWRGVYWVKFPSLSKRIKIVTDWIVSVFSPHDVVRP